MIKPFLNYQQQLDKLTIDKHLIVSDASFAMQKLKDIGYFNLIGGYKKPFRNPMTRVYINNTTFEDVYSLYQFDTSLRKLFFKYLCQIEVKVCTSISYAFCEQFGELQNEYLTETNYNYIPANQTAIDKLVKILKKLAINNTDYEYINYQRNIHNNVPLWVLINALTFGQTSKMYSFLLSKTQSKVSLNFEHVNEKELEQYLKVLVLYRNTCAHNERLFSYKVYSEIPDTNLHRKLGIPKTGNQYVKGKKDLFSVVIAFRYLLPSEDFVLFKKDLVKLIDKYISNTSRITEEELLEMMGFPTNWKDITRYKL